jgi:hypothetical protein
MDIWKKKKKSDYIVDLNPISMVVYWRQSFAYVSDYEVLRWDVHLCFVANMDSKMRLWSNRNITDKKAAN